MPSFVQAFYATFKTAHISAGRMNTKTKIKIYKKVIEQISKKYEGASEFIRKQTSYVQSMEYLLKRYVYIFLCLLCYIPRLAT